VISVAKLRRRSTMVLTMSFQSRLKVESATITRTVVNSLP
jgi:hypothetical protein